MSLLEATTISASHKNYISKFVMYFSSEATAWDLFKGTDSWMADFNRTEFWRNPLSKSVKDVRGWGDRGAVATALSDYRAVPLFKRSGFSIRDEDKRYVIDFDLKACEVLCLYNPYIKGEGGKKITNTNKWVSGGVGYDMQKDYKKGQHYLMEWDIKEGKYPLFFIDKVTMNVVMNKAIGFMTSKNKPKECRPQMSLIDSHSKDIFMKMRSILSAKSSWNYNTPQQVPFGSFKIYINSLDLYRDMDEHMPDFG